MHVLKLFPWALILMHSKAPPTTRQGAEWSMLVAVPCGIVHTLEQKVKTDGLSHVWIWSNIICVTFIHILTICRHPTVTELPSCMQLVASSGSGADGLCPHFPFCPSSIPATDSTAEQNHLPRQQRINWVLGKESSRAGGGA